MKTNRLYWVFFLLLNAALLAWVPGCVNESGSSFNHDYNENLPTSPQYAIDNIDDNHFKVTVHQGEPFSGPQRIIYVKTACSTVADAEAKRRGWVEWKMGYIQQRDQGWMYIVIAEVTREK